MKGLLSQIFKFSVSTWVNFIVGMLTTIITTRFFSEESYAIINIFNTATTTGMTIFCFGLDSGYIRYYNNPPKGNNTRQLVFKLTVFSLLMTVVGGGIVFLLDYKLFSNLLFNDVSLFLCLLLFINISANIIVRYLNITYRMQLNVKKYTVQNIFFQCTARVLVIFAAYIYSTHQFAIFCSVIGMLMLAVIYLFIQRQDIFPQKMELDYGGYKEVFKYSIYCAPVTIIINLNTLVTNLMIKGMIGIEMAGIYASTMSIALIINVLQGGFSTFWSGYMFANYKKIQSLCEKVHDIIMILLMIMFLGLITFKDFIFLLIGKNFREGTEFFSLLLMYPILLLGMETTAYGISISKKTYISFINYMLFFISSIFIGYFAVPIFGVRGMALASSISAIILFVLQTEWAQKYYRTVKSRFRTYFILFLMESIALYDAFTEKNMFNYIVIFVGVIFILVMLYNKEFICYVQKIKEEKYNEKKN